MFDAVTEPTAREIAAATRRTEEHQLAEQRLAELRDRREGFRARWLDALKDPASPDSRKAALAQEITDEERENASKIRAVRLALVPMRAAHADRVGAALDPMRVAAAQRAIDAIAELRAALDLLNEANDEIRKAGGDAPSLRLPSIAHVERALATIAK